MDIKELENLFLTRQSCRKFDKAKKVEKEKLEKIIELSRLAPSACNSQPWSMHVVTDESLLSKVANGCQDMGMNKFVSDATALIVLVEEKASLSERVGAKFKSQDFVSNDMGIITTYITLSAKALGVDTCILGWLSSDKIKETLSIDASKRIRLVVALGYAEEGYPTRQKNRKPLENIVKYYN